MFIVQIDNDELFHIHVHIQKDPIKPKNIFFSKRGRLHSLKNLTMELETRD